MTVGAPNHYKQISFCQAKQAILAAWPLFFLCNPSQSVRVSSVCMSVCVNLERMFAVVYPLKTLRGKGAMIPASLAFALAYNLPKFFELEIGEEGDRLVTTDLRNDPLYRDAWTDGLIVN